ncbi:MAG: SMP-30/gluconolactonase/LRE family protein [Planctomycetota bacterium]|nr:SMP-30/gluconolactonase/LRE family protein [Planctomycetota bacterium]
MTVNRRGFLKRAAAGGGALVAAASCGAPRRARAAEAGADIVAPGAELEKLADGFKFTEGPAADAQGNVYFTDQPTDRIVRWGAGGTCATWMQPCGRSNGLYFDAGGMLLACADEKNQLWAIRPDKTATVVVKEYEGKLLNGPNDLWVRPDGGLYFTDPFYKRPYWDRGPTEQPCQGVYYLSPDRKRLVRVVDDLVQPNGIIGAPGGKAVYVADIRDRKTYRYAVQPSGELGDPHLLCEMGSDGMTVDQKGNVYLTGRGVTVFSPKGEKIHHIDVPERWTANITFGGKDRRLLFITASKGVYGLKMAVRGAG